MRERKDKAKQEFNHRKPNIKLGLVNYTIKDKS